ncbi:MAG: hypothetical protein SCJ94_11530 [Bacillota bacterium]|nr:hypothetical protein [Bacillota bacterium]
MPVKLYALKCNQGYLRCSGDEECRFVTLNKASVYISASDVALLEARSRVLLAGATDLRLVELTLTERDYYSPEP